MMFQVNQMTGWRVAAKYEKRKLLIAVNCVAALSIFFFGGRDFDFDLAI